MGACSRPGTGSWSGRWIHDGSRCGPLLQSQLELALGLAGEADRALIAVSASACRSRHEQGEFFQPVLRVSGGLMRRHVLPCLTAVLEIVSLAGRGVRVRRCARGTGRSPHPSARRGRSTLAASSRTPSGVGSPGGTARTGGAWGQGTNGTVQALAVYDGPERFGPDLVAGGLFSSARGRRTGGPRRKKTHLATSGRESALFHGRGRIPCTNPSIAS